MLRALLEERFRLQFHRETREIQIYSLTVAQERPQLQPSSGRSCTPRDLSQPSLPPGEKPWCGQPRGSKTSRLINTDLPGKTMAQFAQALGLSGPMVIGQTGITEKFDFQVEYAPDGADLSDELTAPSIDSMLGKLGLRLERAKGPCEFLVIDHVEQRIMKGRPFWGVICPDQLATAMRCCAMEAESECACPGGRAA
jgi:uncharacterized protein (TIGR03435 family)